MLRRLLGKMVCWYCKHKGGLYIKLGQIMSNQYASFSNEFLHELKGLQHSISHNLSQSEYDTILSEIHPDIQNVSIVEAGSIAVIFKGVLNGKVVAIKVIRPNIYDTIDNQRVTITWWIDWLDYFYPHYFLSLKWARIYKTLLEQLDMYKEAEHLAFFNEKHTYVVTPKAYCNYSTQRMLVMDWIEGVTLTHVDTLQLDDETKKNLASQYAMFLKECHDFGRIHMDLHPGNVIITSQCQVAIVDFGLVSIIEQQKSTQLLQMVDSTFNKNFQQFARSFIDVYIDNDQNNVDILEQEVVKHCQDVTDRYDGADGWTYEIMRGLYKLVEKHGIYINHEFADFELALITAKDTFMCLWNIGSDKFYLLIS